LTPARVTEPEEGGSRAPRMDRRVLLPEPEGPMMETA
jgi:hypothetical protein